MPQISVNRAMQIAAEQQHAGRFPDAEAIYRQIISQFPEFHPALHHLAILLAGQRRLDESRRLMDRVIQLAPNNAAAHSDLGNVLRDQKHLDDALASLERAIALQPEFAAAHGNLGNVLRDLGRTAEAIAEYHRALQLDPIVAFAHCNLGNAFTDSGRMDEAVAAYRRAIELMPGFAAAHSNLGVALQRLDHPEEAIASMRRAIELAPDYAEAYSNLGNFLETFDRTEEAIAAFARAIQLRPDLAAAHCSVGVALVNKKRIDEAIAALRTALRIQPDSAEAHNNLGNALGDKGCIDEAIAEYREALRLRPKYADAMSNLASTMIEWGRYEEPESLLRQAIECDPKCVDAHWNLALFLLLNADFARGLPEYEWRWKVKKMQRMPNFSTPQWDGRELHGQTILLYVEQGYGDAIQFIRYAPQVAARGAKVILSCTDSLKRLFGRMPAVDIICSPQAQAPDFDFHCPLLSLPLVFNTDLNSIPAPIPYLSPDAELAESWRTKLPTVANRRRIGLAWAGSARLKNDRNRSLPPSALAPLAELTDTDFYSLQKSEGDKPLPPPGLTLIDFTPDITDFADTAALIANLDLVITVDTSVAHLAGAMGKPVWILLPFSPDWRWLLNRSDSPWYPTMRLFRQPAPGDWAAVIRAVADALKSDSGGIA